MNHVILGGRLGKNIELKTVNDFTFANCTIAVRKEFKNKNGEYEADWINVRAFQKTAELLAFHFKKGDYLAISGKLRHDQFKDNNGNNQYFDYVSVTSIDFDACKNHQQQNNNGAGTYQAPNNQYNSNNNQFAMPAGTEITIPDEDLPF